MGLKTKVRHSGAERKGQKVSRRWRWKFRGAAQEEDGGVKPDGAGRPPRQSEIRDGGWIRSSRGRGGRGRRREVRTKPRSPRKRMPRAEAETGRR